MKCGISWFSTFFLPFVLLRRCKAFDKWSESSLLAWSGNGLAATAWANSVASSGDMLERASNRCCQVSIWLLSILSHKSGETVDLCKSRKLPRCFKSDTSCFTVAMVRARGTSSLASFQQAREQSPASKWCERCPATTT